MRRLLLGIFLGLGGVNVATAGSGEPADRVGPSGVAAEMESRLLETLSSLLPTAWQKRPRVQFSVITDMTPEGRKWAVPTPDKPLLYSGSKARFVQMGWQVSAGEKPPPGEQLEATMRTALAANGYVPTTDPEQRPDLLIVFTYGSHGTDPATLASDDEAATLPTNADELVQFVIRDPRLATDVIDRARFMAGDQFALELKAALEAEVSNRRFNQTIGRLPAGTSPMTLPVGPEGGSPFDLFMRGGKRETAEHFAEVAFHTCYFVTATAYDFSGVERKQKVALWQTRMTVEAQGVAMAEVLTPLILGTAAYLGRETREAVVVTKRIDRQGRVEIGTAKVVDEPPPDTAAKK